MVITLEHCNYEMIWAEPKLGIEILDFNPVFAVG